VLVAFPLGFLFLMAGLPLIYNVVMSFQEVDMFSLGTFSRPWVGFKNYVDLFAQPETLPILYNTAIFVVGSIDAPREVFQMSRVAGGAQFGVGYSF